MEKKEKESKLYYFINNELLRRDIIILISLSAYIVNISQILTIILEIEAKKPLEEDSEYTLIEEEEESEASEGSDNEQVSVLTKLGILMNL